MQYLFPSSTLDFDLILVIGGREYEPTPVELVSLDPDNHPVPSCLENLNNFTIPGLWASAGAVDLEGIPFICSGGQNKWPEDPEYYDECYKYVPGTDSWEEQGTMPYKVPSINDVSYMILDPLFPGPVSSKFKQPPILW